MPEAHADLARAFTAAFNSGNVDALIACCDPSVEFHSTFAAVGGAVYSGHDGMRKWYADLQEAWDEIRSELEAVFDVGEGRLLVFTVLHARGLHSGAAAVLSVATVTTLRNGLFDYYKAYIHREDALAELGVTEDELEPMTP